MSQTDTRASLHRLCSSHSLTFGMLLLQSADEGAVPFRAFVRVAEQIIAERPQQAAIHLAALVALDMDRATAEEGGLRDQPSRN